MAPLLIRRYIVIKMIVIMKINYTFVRLKNNRLVLSA